MKAIVAMSENRLIGAGNKLPWHIPDDLKFFKATTLGHIVLMGRKTYESLGRPLPGRENWVLTRTETAISGVRTIRSLEEIQPPPDGREIFIIGGAEVYRALLPHCTHLYITHIFGNFSGDVYFPPFEQDFFCETIIAETPQMRIERYARHNHETKVLWM